MKLLLTSRINHYVKTENGERIVQNFGNENCILDLIKKLTPNQNNLVFVASDETAYETTDMYAKLTIESFNLTFPFKNYTILDGRTESRAKEIIENADFIYLCGGHVPTQNRFFEKINLREIIKNTNALIIGASAGSMNSANIVYAQPELEGESVNPNYKKYLRGLSLTTISVLPHFKEQIDSVLDGKNVLKEISIPDSKIRPFIAFSDGAHIFDNGSTQLMFGEAFLFDGGSFQQISQNNTITNITELVEDKFNYANLNLL